MKIYKQIGSEERVEIARLRGEGKSVRQIASVLKRCPSTISRELRRNQAPPGKYWPDTAQQLSGHRRRRPSRLDRDLSLQDFVITKLICHGWTPEQIAAWLKYQQKELTYVSHETIYRWIYAPGQKGLKLWKMLPRHKAKRGLRKYRGSGVHRIPGRVSIHDRPKSVSKRREFGHWEGDLMSFQKNTQHIVVLQERKTRYILSNPLPGKKAVSTKEQMSALMKQLPQRSRRTITFDNGGEFSGHEQLSEEMGLKTFFCDPYASWQKGGIENANGRLRRDLPRKTDVKNMKQEDFDEIIDNYNTTPRKCLGWLTPQQAFFKNLQRVALQT